MRQSPLKVAWITYFPIEWLPDLPESLRIHRRLHPATWQRVLYEELNHRSDLELHVFTLGKHFRRNFSFTRANATFHCLRASLKLRTLSTFWWDAMLLRKHLRRIQPDLVHAWGSERGAALVASRLSYPYLVTMQGLLQWYQQQTDLGWFARTEARLEHVALRRAKVVSTESSFGVTWLRGHYPNLEVHQIEHAPSWVFHRLQRRPVLQPLQFLFIGPMSRLKGTDLLLTALDRLRGELDFRLTIVGSAHESFVREMKAHTSQALWEQITMRSGLSQAEVVEEIGRATLMIFPTRADTSPNSVKEAAVSGLPVVASAVGGIVDYVKPDRNGFTVPPQDVEALIGAIKHAVAHPLFGRGTVCADTLNEIRRYLSPALMAEKFLGAYKSVLDAGN